MAIIGQTGSGKTTLANALITARTYTLSLRSKRDTTPLPGKRVRTARDFARTDIQQYHRIVLDPDYERQRAEFSAAFDVVWREGKWCIYCDETYYLEDHVKIGRHIIRMLTQGRSNGITMVLGMQRPAWVSRFCLSEPSHLIAFRTEPRDIKTLAETGSDEWAEAVRNLEPFQFAWFYRPSRAVFVGRVQDLTTV